MDSINSISSLKERISKFLSPLLGSGAATPSNEVRPFSTHEEEISKLKLALTIKLVLGMVLSFFLGGLIMAPNTEELDAIPERYVRTEIPLKLYLGPRDEKRVKVSLLDDNQEVIVEEAYLYPDSKTNDPLNENVLIFQMDLPDDSLAKILELGQDTKLRAVKYLTSISSKKHLSEQIYEVNF